MTGKFAFQKPMLGGYLDEREDLARGLVYYCLFQSKGGGEIGSASIVATALPDERVLESGGTAGLLAADQGKSALIGDLTIFARVNPAVIDGTHTIAKKDGNYILRYNPSTAQLIYWNGSDIRQLDIATLATNSWQTIAGVVKGNDAFKVYVNGSAGGGSTVTIGNQGRNLLADLTLGNATTGGEGLKGKLSLVYLYNRALSDHEITKLNRRPFCMFKSQPCGRVLG